MACNLPAFIGVREFKQTLGKHAGEVRTLVELWFYTGLQTDEAKPILEPGGRGEIACGLRTPHGREDLRRKSGKRDRSLVD